LGLVPRRLTALSDEEFCAASNVLGEDVLEIFDVRQALVAASAAGENVGGHRPPLQ